MIPVILSGGVGSRLWPLSRGMYPKQLLPLIDDELSMLQQTLLRAADLESIEAPIVVCNEEQRFMVGEQISQLQTEATPKATIILEPVGRNTAPAIALAALQAMSKGDDPLLLVMPADHVIANQAAFQDAVSTAARLAETGKLVTFGIVPEHAETGYGYIKAGDSLGEGGFQVEEFKEKPSSEIAEQYVQAGNYYWNGGIFLFRASAYLAELKQFAPDIFTACEQAMQSVRPDLDFLRVDPVAFAKSPADSIDYAVMEHTQHAAIVPLKAGWNDVGSWRALWEVSPKDENGNSTHGDVLTVDTRNSHIYAENKLVATVDLENMIVVQTDDAVLVASQAQSQRVKDIVAHLQLQDRTHIDHHRKVYRPWGWYDALDEGKRFKVKRIMVKPGAKLSVQIHAHRAEHWVVVAGEAEVTNGDTTTRLQVNESTYIPIGVVHSLCNPSATEPLEIVEVQSGDYLGEDDIVRYEDNYGRVENKTE